MVMYKIDRRGGSKNRILGQTRKSQLRSIIIDMMWDTLKVNKKNLLSQFPLSLL